VRFLPLVSALLLTSCAPNERSPSAPIQVASTGNVMSADGVPIRYEILGAGQPALVFIHGWACDRRFWDEQVAHFAPRHTVVTLDLGGHGESGTNRSDWTMQAFGEDVRAVVEHLDLRPVVLIGHSMGGAVIIEAARRLPGRVTGLVAADTLHNVEEHISPTEIEQYMAPLRANFAEGTRARVAAALFRPETDSNLVRRVADRMSQLSPAVGLSAMENLLHYDAAAALARVTVPVQCIDSDLYPVNAEAGWRHAVSFNVTVLRDTGHFLMLEDPDRFNRALERALRQLQSRHR
jgi:pimeloyl-ACP methyl ester carboxylesterase